jgi:hypothetical protein
LSNRIIGYVLQRYIPFLAYSVCCLAIERGKDIEGAGKSGIARRVSVPFLAQRGVDEAERFMTRIINEWHSVFEASKAID